MDVGLLILIRCKISQSIYARISKMSYPLQRFKRSKWLEKRPSNHVIFFVNNRINFFSPLKTDHQYYTKQSLFTLNQLENPFSLQYIKNAAFRFKIRVKQTKMKMRCGIERRRSRKRRRRRGETKLSFYRNKATGCNNKCIWKANKFCQTRVTEAPGLFG